MEGSIIIIRSPADITSIDTAILDNLSGGVEIYVLKMSHMQCNSADNAKFYVFTNNIEHSRKCIFIDEIMIDEMKIVETVYYNESRLSMYPCPSDPMDKFHWKCPFCNRQFNEM